MHVDRPYVDITACLLVFEECVYDFTRNLPHNVLGNLKHLFKQQLVGQKTTTDKKAFQLHSMMHIFWIPTEL